MSHGYPTARGIRGPGPRPSKMHGTLCRCGKERKAPWQLVGPNCFRRLPSELRDDVVRARKVGSAGDRLAMERSAIEWLIANPES